MAQILSIAKDLMLASRVEAMLIAAGHEVTQASSLEADLLGKAELVVADLDAVDPQALGELDVPVLGYYSHVDVETRKAAEVAGIDLVVPRSRMARELPSLAEQLLS